MFNRNWKALLAVCAAVLALSLGAGAVAAQTDQPPEPGVVIISVAADGPAAKAGVKRGDILLSIDGKAVNSQADVLDVLDSLKSGARVKLEITRGEQPRTLTATLGERNGRAYLGVSLGVAEAPAVLETFRGARFMQPGATITEVVADSPAADAGLQVGDTIVGIDGQRFTLRSGLAEALAAKEPGDTIELDVVDTDRKNRTVEVTLGENPDQPGKAYLGVRYQITPRPVAMSLDGTAPDGPYFYRNFPPRALLDRLDLGAVVIQVTEDSPAAAAGLQVGDIITAIDDEEVASASALTEAIAQHKPGDKVTLTVQRAGTDGLEETTLTVTLGGSPDDASKAYLGVSLSPTLQNMPWRDMDRPGRWRNLLPELRNLLPELRNLLPELQRPFQRNWQELLGESI